jgi:alkylation response protein AidB-like acyl-CoA dehydrogenase
MGRLLLADTCHTINPAGRELILRALSGTDLGFLPPDDQPPASGADRPARSRGAAGSRGAGRSGGAGRSRHPADRRRDLAVREHPEAFDRPLSTNQGVAFPLAEAETLLAAPVAYVENMLHEHPDVAAVAVVGLPHPRLQERACAAVVLKNGAQRFTMEDMRTFLAGKGVTRQYWPERLELLPELPRTASGKIRKFEIREMLR